MIAKMQSLPVLILLSLVTVSLQQPPGVPPRQNQPPHHSPTQHHQTHDAHGQQQGGHEQQQGGHGQPQQQQGGHAQPQQQQGGHGQPQDGHGQPQQQQPQGGHGHGHHSTLEFASEIHNAEHMLEHLQNVISTKPKDQLTAEELEFHYFKMHDYDNNNLLDGVEIRTALTHYHDDTNTTDSPPPSKVLSDDDLAVTVDNIMDTFDEDKNGYVAYVEFKRMSRPPAERQQTGA